MKYRDIKRHLAIYVKIPRMKALSAEEEELLEHDFVLFCKFELYVGLPITILALVLSLL